MELGECMWVAGFKIEGEVGANEAGLIVESLIKAIGLSPAPGVSALYYPTADGKGGVGTTYFQPITESFIVVDSYPEIKTAHVLISSCVEFSAPVAGKAISEVGFMIRDLFARCMR